MNLVKMIKLLVLEFAPTVAVGNFVISHPCNGKAEKITVESIKR
jgi:hypothetical protein